MISHPMAMKKETKKYTRAEMASVIGAALVLFGVYRYLSRQPSNSWIHDFLDKYRGRVESVNLWVPGVNSKVGYQQGLEDDFRHQDLRCPIAWYPYSSVNVPLDLFSAVIDKIPTINFRPQITNIQLALALFLANFKTVNITCHSHGGLLVKRALEGLRLRKEGDGGRVIVSAFGPAALVPQISELYQIDAAVNWVNREDILVKTGVLRLPDALQWNDGHEPQEVKVGADMYKVIARDSRNNLKVFQAWCERKNLQLDWKGIGPHSCYPFQVGLMCADRSYSKA